MPRSNHQATPAPERFSSDIIQFLRLLEKHRVRYLIVGGDAVVFHGNARFTGDIDIFYSPCDKNADSLFNALNEFWSGEIPNLHSPKDLQEPATVVQFGRPPNRLDLMNFIDGVEFEEAWNTRVKVSFKVQNTEIPSAYLSKDLLLKNKIASGRPKDLEDIKFLTGS